MKHFIILLILITGTIGQAYPQNFNESAKYRFAAGQSITGSGHSTCTHLQMQVIEKDHLFSIELAGKLGNQTLTSAGFNYAYTLTPPDKNIRLSIFYKAIYRWKQPLNARLGKFIYTGDGGYNTFNTLENYTGFHFDIQLLPGICSFFQLGAGFYQRKIHEKEDFRINNYVRYSADCGIALYYATGLSITL